MKITIYCNKCGEAMLESSILKGYYQCGYCGADVHVEMRDYKECINMAKIIRNDEIVKYECTKYKVVDCCGKPKLEKYVPTYRRGQCLNLDGSIVMICNHNHYEIVLISIDTGNRWSDTTSVYNVNKITEEEIRTVMGSSSCSAIRVATEKEVVNAIKSNPHVN